MAMLDVNYSAPILRNKGVPVHLIRLDEAGDPVTKDEHDEETNQDYQAVVSDIAYLRITNNTLADLEEIYGSVMKFEEAIDEHPTTAIRAVYGLAERVLARSQLAFSRIPPQGMGEAATAVTTAFGPASGMDLEQAVGVHRKG